VGAIDLAHATRAEQRQDFVSAEPVAGGKRQACSEVSGLYRRADEKDQNVSIRP
jgi:hypothetical protein